MKTKPPAHDMAMMHIRVPQELKDRLEAAATADFRDLSSLVRMVLTQWHDTHAQPDLREKPATYKTKRNAA